MTITGQQIASSMDNGFSALTGLLLGRPRPYTPSVSPWDEVELRPRGFGIPVCCASEPGILCPAPLHLEQGRVRGHRSLRSPGLQPRCEKLGALSPEMWGERGRRQLPRWVKSCLLLSQQERKEQVGVRKQFFSYCCMSNRASYCFVYPIG